MKKYVGALVNTFLNVNNVRISDEVIKDIIEKQPNVAVTINFAGTPIGSTTRFFENGSELYCEIEIEDSKIQGLIDKAYIVPGMDNIEFHNQGDTRVVDSGDLTEVSISLLPIHPHIRPIKLKGDKNE